MLALTGTRLIDGNGGDVIRDPVVLVEGQRIKQVGIARQVDVPSDAEVVDMGGYTLMPGLIDTHVHLLAFNITTFRNYRVALFEVTPQLHMLYALLHAQMCMEMGFTTIRDEGRVSYTGLLTVEMVAIRDAINNGILPGPRILAAAWVSITNSHLDAVLPGNISRPPGTNADGPWELRKLVRTSLRQHCDVIKTVASGGGATDKEAADIQNMTQEELDAICEEAHFFGKPVSCHCFTANSQKMSVRAGVDTIEHCVFTDDEAVAMMKDVGVPVVPTLAHRTDRAIEARRKMGASEFVTKKMKSIQPFTKETFQRFHEAGIKIAMGTDTSVDPEMGANAIELEIYVDYGMTPMEAIQTATKNAAEAIWLDKDTGTIEAGKYADIIAVDGNPLDDIRILQERRRIAMVMKEGRIYVDKRPGREKHVIHDQSYGWKLA